MYEDLKEQTRNSFNELCETAQFKPGSLIVVGGSSSEVRGGVIGKDSSYEVGKTVTSTIIEEAGKRHLRLAFQCCEHLNRAFSTSAFYQFKDPVAVERVAASGGIDIGLTMIGMHLKRVAVPIRLKANRIGQAYVSGAKTRPPLIGGERAHYTREDGMD
mgnify:CR=1 FL=1